MEITEYDDGKVHVLDCISGDTPINIKLDSTFLSAVADRGDTHVVRIDATDHRTLIASSSDTNQLKDWYTENRSNAYNSIAQEAYVVSKDGSIEDGFRNKTHADTFVCRL